MTSTSNDTNLTGQPDDELLARLQADVVTWRPTKDEPGAILLGRVTEVSTGFSDFSNSDYPILAVVADEGTTATDPETKDKIPVGSEVRVHAFQTVLKNEVAGKKPRVGDRIGISYLGKDGDPEYHNFRVILNRTAPEMEPDWASIEAQAADAMAGYETPPLGVEEEQAEASAQ